MYTVAAVYTHDLHIFSKTGLISDHPILGPEIQIAASLVVVERTWLFFVFVVYRRWELLVLLVLVKLVLLVGRSVLSVVLMRRRRLVVLLVVVVAIGLGHGAEAAETRWHGVDEVWGVRTVAV